MMRRRKNYRHYQGGRDGAAQSSLRDDDSLAEASLSFRPPATPTTGNVSTILDQHPQPQPRIEIIVSVLLWIIRFGGCVLFAYGMYLGKTQLCTHEECDMTYSRRVFLELNVEVLNNRSPPSHPYRLYKFMDQRDPRHTPFLKQAQPLGGNAWCLNNNGVDSSQSSSSSTTTVVPVLFIPGHGGSFQQSRSLGAHGIQLTARQDMTQQRRAVHALRHNLWTGTNATTLDAFVYDVYALDFEEEGAGLHGTLVEHQSAMVADAIEFLTQTCHFDDKTTTATTGISIVAHSIGGYAARLALIDYPEIQSMVRNVVTLATPHAFPVLAVEPYLHSVYQRLSQGVISNSIALVSIGGGIRDEMIPPRACHAKSSSSSNGSGRVLNLAAVDIMSAGTVEAKTPPALGMDHRAIVWCHNLLLSVRKILFVLNNNNDDMMDDTGTEERILRLSKSFGLTDNYDYLNSVEESRVVFADMFGKWQSMVAEIGLLYSLERLVGLYFLSSAMYAKLGISPWTSLLILHLAPGIMSHSSKKFPFSWGCLYILSLVANTVSVALIMCLERVSLWLRWLKRFTILPFTSTVFPISFNILCIIRCVLHEKLLPPHQHLSQMLALALVPTAILLSIRRGVVSPQPQMFVYSAWIVILLPLLSAGLFYSTLIRRREVPVAAFIMIVFPCVLVPMWPDSFAGNRQLLYLSNFAFMVVLVIASTMMLHPGTITKGFL